jgi:hypothetical protein
MVQYSPSATLVEMHKEAYALNNIRPAEKSNGDPFIQGIPNGTNFHNKDTFHCAGFIFFNLKV